VWTATVQLLRSGEPERARLSLCLSKIATIVRGKIVAHGSRIIATISAHQIAAPELIAK